jgi:hypothetical protein
MSTAVRRHSPLFTGQTCQAEAIPPDELALDRAGSHREDLLNRLNLLRFTCVRR